MYVGVRQKRIPEKVDEVKYDFDGKLSTKCATGMFDSSCKKLYYINK